MLGSPERSAITLHFLNAVLQFPSPIREVRILNPTIEKEFEESYEFAQSSPFPEPEDFSKGLWVEDGYWTSEPGRGGGRAVVHHRGRRSAR